MHEYDTVLKTLLQYSPNSVVRQITGATIKHWHNVEIPKVEQTRVDLLGESSDGELVHIELQSTNDPLMALRMAEYSLRVYRLFRRFARQIVLYVGGADMNMISELVGPQHSSQYTLIDVRNLDSESLLQSPWLADNIMAILTRLRHQRTAVKQILSQIVTLEPGAKETAIAQLLILAGLRKLEGIIRTELETMPIEHSIMDHEIIGPAIRQGLQQGLQQGMQQESLLIVRKQLEKRFGRLPSAIEQYLNQLPVSKLEDLSLRLLDAHSLDELFSL